MKFYWIDTQKMIDSENPHNSQELRDLEERKLLHNQEDPPRPFNDPKPEIGYEFKPPLGTVPTQKVMDKCTQEIFKAQEYIGSTYVGETNEQGEKHGFGMCTYINSKFDIIFNIY